MMISEPDRIERAAIAINELRKDLVVEFDDLRGQQMTQAIVQRIAMRIGVSLVRLEETMGVEVVNHVQAEVTLRGRTLEIDLVGRTEHGHALIGAAERLIEREEE